MNFTYTDFGAVLKRTDARNVETHHKYDTLNRPTQVWYTGLNGSDDPNATRPPLPTGVVATSDVIIAFNNLASAAAGNGETSRIDDGAGFETYAYDSLGRTITKTRTIDGVNSYSTGYQYNAVNQLTVITYPSNKQVRMNHDLRGRMSGIDKLSGGVFVSSYVSGVAYNSAGQVTGMTDGSGVVENYTYSNDRLQLTRQTATKSTTTLMDLNYNYSAAAGASGVGTVAGNSGQLMAITNNPSNQPSTINSQNRNQTFTYDDLGRLVTATGWGAWQRRFDYDGWGNRTAVRDATSGGNQIQSVVLEQQQGAPAGVPNNRIATVNAVGYTYDAAGNLTYDGAHTYQYDGEGRIATVDTTGASYSYDSANQRVKKVVGTGASAVTTYYVWEGAQVIAEYSNAPAGAGGTSYYLADRLSTRMTTDTNGVFKGTQDHLPFGEEGGTSGTVEKHRFTSYERDTESGSDYAMNRQHQYANGRFVQPDPVPGAIRDPQSLNRYVYSNNDPINLSDPLGLESGVLSAQYSGRGCRIDGFDAPCWAANALLGMDAAVIYNGPTLVFSNGQWQMVGFDALGDKFYRGFAIPKPSFIDWLVGRVLDFITVISPPLGDILRFRYITWRTGLSAHINSWRYNADTRTFTIDFKESVRAFLRNNPDFLGGNRIGALLHGSDVGTRFGFDYRSITGGALGGLSMQVVYNPSFLNRSYADFDRFNPYQDLFGFFGHMFGEVIWHKLRRVGNMFP